ncbi:MAG TPA: serine/threonine-protein kinase [Candidatus Dormibacteraeota bacterium]
MHDPAQRRASLHQGEQVGRFRIGWLVGTGATSEVYVANDERDRRDIVLKLIRATSPGDEHLRRLQREVEALATAEHPNVLRVYECGQLRDHAYLVTDFAAGGSLDARLRSAQPTTAQALRLLTGIAAGLDHVHGLGIIHGDVKPANVLLTARARPLLTDFGIAHLPSWSSSASAAREPAHPVGTPFYMSPEQVRCEPLDRPSDVYSFAVLAYQLLSGRLPFSAEVSADVMYMHLASPPPPLSTVSPALPAQLDAVLEKGLAKPAGDRWSSCSEMVAAIAIGLGPVPLAAAERRRQSVAGRVIGRLLPRLARWQPV